MRVSVTGAAGLFGYALVREFAKAHQVTGLTRQIADLTDHRRVREVLRGLRPELLIHSAAIRDLDIAERDPAQAQAVNVEATRNLAEIARELDAALVQISTDAVFGGGAARRTPYAESDPVELTSVYARTKFEAEQIVGELPRHWIFRVSVLFGPGGENYVLRVIKSVAAGKVMLAPSDQMGSATYTLDAAAKIREIVESGRNGLYHLSNSGACGRDELARRAVELAGLEINLIRSVPADEMRRPAVRPKYHVMEMRALSEAGFALPRPWQEALAEYVPIALATAA
jgi:dTDP-4-dehydrorhamnose reductase